MGPISVFLADDVPDFRYLTRLLVEEDPGLRVVGDCGGWECCLTQIVELKPDVALMDHLMPGPSMADRLRALRERAPETAVIIFSGMPERLLAREAEEVGAAGYLSKDVSPDRLREAIRAVVPDRPSQ